MIQSLEYHENVLSDSVELASTSFKQISGLMFRFNIPEKHSLLFVLEEPTDVTIHMLFVFFTIDVIFLDHQQKIVGLKHLKPFLGFATAKDVSYIIEMKSGTIKKFNLTLNEKIEFKTT